MLRLYDCIRVGRPRTHIRGGVSACVPCRFVLGCVAVLLGAGAVFVVACEAPQAVHDEPAGRYEQPLQVEIVLEAGHAEFASMQMLVEYDVEQLEMHQLTSLLPDTMRLEYDATHLGRGQFRVLCVPRQDASGVAPGERNGSLEAAEPLRVARLQLSARSPGVVPQVEWVRISRYRIFGPLPEQPDVTDEVEVRLQRVGD